MTQSPNSFNQKNMNSEYRTPKWVKIFGIVGLTLILAFVTIHLLGGGFRGHTPP